LPLAARVPTHCALSDMPPYSLFNLLLVLSTVARASPARRASAVRDQRNTPNAFVAEGPADSDAVLDFRIGLASRDRRGLEQALYEVSTPGKSRYGQHLSNEEVSNLGISICSGALTMSFERSKHLRPLQKIQ
jgi:hypothetical protein